MEIRFNPNEFDQKVWQTDTEFTQKEYKEWFENAVEVLQDIYDDYDGEADVYILGDIINLLTNVEIKPTKRQ